MIFGRYWPIYVRAGWTQLTVLPPRSKCPPMADTTGRNQKPVSEDTYRYWTCCERRHGVDGNLGVVLPEGVICLDVDSSHGHARQIDGARNLRQKEKELGPLPLTWTSGHGAPDSPYRHYLYRVPNDVGALRAVCEGVDLIQHTHRYVTAPPSVHPSGENYYWLRPDGSRAEDGVVPRVDELPVLPEAWLDAMRSGPTGDAHADGRRADRPRTGRHATSGEGGGRSGAPCVRFSPRALYTSCKACRSVVERWIRNPRYGMSCRHDGTLKAMRILSRLDAAGHVGAVRASEEIVERYQTLISDRATPQEARDEAMDMRTWAWVNTHEGTSSLFDPCVTYRPRRS